MKKCILFEKLNINMKKIFQIVNAIVYAINEFSISVNFDVEASANILLFWNPNFKREFNFEELIDTCAEGCVLSSISIMHLK